MSFLWVKSLPPGGGPRYGPPGVHQHTPAVAGGGVALDRLVQSSLGTVWYEYSIVLVLPRLFLGRLLLLVTR